MSGDWRPTAQASALRLRARLLAATREFFASRGVLEVETGLVVIHAVSDVQIESIRLAGEPPRYLHTSPEYAMKRLLAAGIGDIFQVCKVFRAEERSALHNPEFTMVEWYRVGMDLDAIMAETAALVAALLAAGAQSARPVEHISYAQAFERELGCDPLVASHEQLSQLSRANGLVESSLAASTRDDLLDFLVAAKVGPRLGRGRLTCLHHFPASQASLAQIEPDDPRTALRFELFAEGIELANGYVELANPDEQRRRFEADLAERRRRGMAEPVLDERLLAALDAGLPPCAGVAMGFDRVALLALGASHLREVMAFDWTRA